MATFGDVTAHRRAVHVHCLVNIHSPVNLICFYCGIFNPLLSQTFKEEFQVEFFKLDNAEPRNFVISKLMHMLFYPIWTVIWAVFHLLNLLLMPYYRIDLAPYPEPWPFYLSNWACLILAVHAVLDCVITFYIFLKKQPLLVPDPAGLMNTPWYEKLLWVTYNITNVTTLTMTLLLGSLVTYRADAPSILIQIFSSFYVIANIIIGGKETRILHAYQPMAYLFLYILFNLIYSAASGNAIYPTMDWAKTPGYGILWLLCILLLIAPLIHLLVYGIYRLREFIVEKCKKDDVPV
ncbi:uncharacterized protein LOC133195246 [Saccostrea echinata]|uniref:uncharacterized protein LOC133195246 n=1 Tax=Saccostrea echinata TaxID=191078 RepID=UPI002A7FB9AC|nr:uncharacterized protein LOC133195246 [Saccostrea echinata]